MKTQINPNALQGFSQANTGDALVKLDSEHIGFQNVAGNYLPSQTGQRGKFLSTDGSQGVWADVDALPSQTGQRGKFLSTDGSQGVWTYVDALPSQTGQAGKFLSTDGSQGVWTDVDGLPSQTGQAGKFLSTDGSQSVWADTPTSNIVIRNWVYV